MWRYVDGDLPVELCAVRARAGRWDTRAADSGRRARAGREDAEPPLRVVAQRAASSPGYGAAGKGKRLAVGEKSSGGGARSVMGEEEASTIFCDGPGVRRPDLIHRTKEGGESR